MVEHFLCRIANPAGRLTVVQKGGPENKKVDQKLGMIFCILSPTIRPTIIKVLLQSLLLASNQQDCFLELILEKVYDLTFVIIEKVYLSGYSVVLTIEKQLLPLTATTAFSFTTHQLFYYNTYCIITKAPDRLLDALVEGGEKRLALQYIAGSMDLTHQDAATAHRKRTVARLNHRNRLGGSIIHRNQIRHLAVETLALANAHTILSCRKTISLTLYGAANLHQLNPFASNFFHNFECAHDGATLTQ